jgi:hypothetical protein
VDTYAALVKGELDITKSVRDSSDQWYFDSRPGV